jgi:hypothetical protein
MDKMQKANPAAMVVNEAFFIVFIFYWIKRLAIPLSLESNAKFTVPASLCDDLNQWGGGHCSVSMCASRCLVQRSNTLTPVGDRLISDSSLFAPLGRH